ncbi:MAG: patatin-like phospholipase family protein [Neomegalonema sp.]|nr:patatin-like phospholipase family protein [Neomegalonema sp.]
MVQGGVFGRVRQVRINQSRINQPCVKRWARLFATAGRRVVVSLVAAAVLAGCAGPILRTAPPESGWRKAITPVAPAARVWADHPPAKAAAMQDGFVGKLVDRLRLAEARGEKAQFTILALSGGAADGAYGAGVLAGWTKTGERPKFDYVTGVSTGALIAPFAFLGSEYDSRLEALFTQTSTNDLLELALFSALTGGLGLVDNAPFKEAIAKNITPEVLAKIAAEHRLGRRLYVATTNLDARRSVIWDMGAIASRGDDAALRLFRKVVLASASIPGAFPPVYFDVEIDGKKYKEMHVDGGVTMSVFIAPSWVKLDGATADFLKGKTTIYVIQNNKIVPNYGPTDDKLISIASSSISEMIRTQARGDQLRIFSIAERNGFNYRVTFVPTSFSAEQKEAFDPKYMRLLFDVGLKRGVAGVAWLDEPPELPSTLRRRSKKEAAEAAALKAAPKLATR